MCLVRRKVLGITFPKCETLSYKLTWSHYDELLKCEDLLEMKFYMKECIKEMESQKLKRQMKFSLFHVDPVQIKKNHQVCVFSVFSFGCLGRN